MSETDGCVSGRVPIMPTEPSVWCREETDSPSRDANKMLAMLHHCEYASAAFALQGTAPPTGAAMRKRQERIVRLTKQEERVVRRNSKRVRGGN